MQATEEVILLGDFNVPDINWATLSGSSNLSSNPCDLIFQHNYMQQVDTYPWKYFGPPENTISGINLTQEFYQAIKSDHCLISFKLHLTFLSPMTSKDPVYIFTYHKGDHEGLYDLLYNTDFSTCYQSSDVEFI